MIKIVRTRVRNSDPATSRAAAVAQDGSAARVRGLVMDILNYASPDGLTDEELRARCEEIDPYLSESSPRKRRGELVRDGLVEQVVDGDGSPVTRKSEHGRQMTVWRASR
jgi:hypothetical protein